MLALLFSVSSCREELKNLDPNPNNTSTNGRVEGSTNRSILGTKLNNPYSVQNMLLAYQNLTKSKDNPFTNPIQIQTTHYYVRFLPTNEQEKEYLEEALMLFDMPLDYEFPSGDNLTSYYTPALPDGQIDWQHTVVPVDYQFGNITYEIIENLFLQDEINVPVLSAKRILSTDLWTILENEALRITGNDDDIIDDNQSNERRKWNPSGRIQYEDNTNSPSSINPLEGAKVVVKRWFKWKTTLTDANGYFRVGSFKSKVVKCAIKWERADFDIRSGSYGQAWYAFEKLRKGQQWNIAIQKNGTPKNWLYANVHRGAVEYFYNHAAYDIQKPYDKNQAGLLSVIFPKKLHIGAKDKKGRGHYFTFNNIVWSAPVVVYSAGDNGAYDSRQIFGTTVHELTHVSHWRMGYSTGQFVIDALAGDPVLPESWATGVEYVIVENVYPQSLFPNPYENNYGQWLSLQQIKDSKGYTPIVIDMIDFSNQMTRTNPNRPNDRASGYTLGQLERALPGSLGSWWMWRTEIREKYTNPTEKDPLDYLFREYKK